MNAEFRARLNLFPRTDCAGRTNKKPRDRVERGARGMWREAGYFVVVKMSFAYCDLWCAAELRWMTWLLTARSRAEL